MRMQACTLATADYSLAGCEDLIALERKSLPDLVQCVGPERERFRRELIRLRGYPFRTLLVEAAWCDVEQHTYQGKMNAQSITASIAAWTGRFELPVFFAGDRQAAERFARLWLFHAGRTIWQRAAAIKLNGDIMERRAMRAANEQNNLAPRSGQDQWGRFQTGTDEQSYRKAAPAARCAP
jgi:hypothetical protein